VTCITVLDISGAAIARAQERIGARQTEISWIEADVTADWPVPSVDIWHDRAVFHFLTDAGDRGRYRARLRAGLRPGGSLIIAAFGPGGPAQCSGLPTMRYAPEALAAEFGPSFRLEETVRELHTTPSATTQEFWYSRFTAI
jgi:SAM-dependent methyltransferase